MARVRGIHANVAGRRKVPKIRKHLRRGWADEVWITEGYRIVPWLRQVAPQHGYQVKAWRRAKFGPEARDVVLVIRATEQVDRRRPMRMRRAWRGLNLSRIRGPRVFTRLIRPDIRSIGLHLPPHSRGHNRGSRDEAMRRIARRLSKWTTRGRPAYAVGDWNYLRHELRRQLPGHFKIRSRRKVSHLVTINCRRSRVRRIKQPRGTHGWFRYVIRY